ncbi:DUF898 family protein [Candidatus Aquiluna sp. UB-MaderosW2red]|uniref:DUF898 family protein n=1 Tax=Candidatus Aquiluna sp. UB-MaderosW2red TaxID=1855377 RepID=UPI000875BF43|nr:DUF898 family protein [Candidatus Aquiluna sp. UB-MaderosW2red]SCX08349.1 protein of unknown function [Candidatus Aquiluna sp. UB-MaderosW2red]
MEFQFRGGATTYWGTALLGALITILSLGFLYPFALVLNERWRAKHSFIGGRQLEFSGSAFGLLGRWILWLVLICCDSWNLLVLGNSKTAEMEVGVHKLCYQVGFLYLG